MQCTFKQQLLINLPHVMENLTVASFCMLLRLLLQQLTVVALWPYVGVPGAQALPLYCTLVKVDTASIGVCVS